MVEQPAGLEILGDEELAPLALLPGLAGKLGLVAGLAQIDPHHLVRTGEGPIVHHPEAHQLAPPVGIAALGQHHHVGLGIVPEEPLHQRDHGHIVPNEGDRPLGGDEVARQLPRRRLDVGVGQQLAELDPDRRLRRRWKGDEMDRGAHGSRFRSCFA